MQRRPTVDPRRLFLFLSSSSFTARTTTTICCRLFSSNVSMFESSDDDESSSKNSLQGLKSIYKSQRSSHERKSFTNSNLKRQKRTHWRIRGGQRLGADPGAAVRGGSGVPMKRRGGPVGLQWPAVTSADMAGTEGRGRTVGGCGMREGNARGLKCPSRQVLFQDTEHRWGGRKPVFSRVGGQFTAPLKRI